ncbi:hypothetical protein [Lysobacter sp. CA199]|uniref:hypothetical protein n=1 Tax=Lysobacter sp. CA199 TaxID=3455608 RepID=UPI003F8D7095
MNTRKSLLALAACLVLGHAHAAEPAPPASPTTGAPAAPWSVRALSPKSVPAVYLSEWKKAKNRGRCASLALQGADKQAGIKVRRADFSDGWAVAYDLPGQRSAFGVAGTGVDIDRGGSTYKFPHTLTWADGSQANYGLRGGTGPGYLAYLQVAGQRCLYNVWSERSQEHLEQLLRSLRRVKTS